MFCAAKRLSAVPRRLSAVAEWDGHAKLASSANSNSAGAGAGGGPAASPLGAGGSHRAQDSLAFAKGALDAGVAWTLCCVCQVAVPSSTCRSCGDVFCDSCFAAVHRGRLGAHTKLLGVVVDALPAPSLAAQSVRDDEAEWVIAARRSYTRTARQSYHSIRAFWMLWLRSVGRGALKDSDVAGTNPEVQDTIGE